MWKSKLQSVERDPHNNSFVLLTFLFEHTDRRTEVVMDRFSDPKGYLQYVKDFLRNLEMKDALETFISNPPIGDIKTEPDIIEQTPEEKRKQEFVFAREGLTRAKQDLEMKLITQAEFDIKVAEVKAKRD